MLVKRRLAMWFTTLWGWNSALRVSGGGDVPPRVSSEPVAGGLTTSRAGWGGSWRVSGVDGDGR